LISDGILISDTTLADDFRLEAQAALINGDATTSMPVVIDSGIDFIGF